MPIKVNFEVGDEHLQLWENQDWRYGLVMGGRGNGRSGTASRYMTSRLFGEEYTRGAVMRAVKEDIRTSCWQEIIDRIDEQEVRDAKGLSITDHNMHIAFGKNSIQAHGYKVGPVVKLLNQITRGLQHRLE
jgi:phage terminase large subunit